jgi:arginine N-succinyltransferase
LTQHHDIFRVAQTDDIDAILSFTSHAHNGLTNVPTTYEAVNAQIQETQDTFAKKPGANRILFVVERDGKVLGISAIILRLGGEVPFYNFKRSRHSGRAANPKLAIDYDTLQITTDFHAYSEVASLFMSPEGRGTGLAKLLSMGRFGYIQNHREDFLNGIMAEILGWVDADGVSPFWQHLASRFIDMEFDNADKLSTVDKRFIVDLLPALPIMLNLLPPIVSEVTGKPHDNSRPALNMLKSIGFEETDMCDVFDGGPAIRCQTDKTWIARTTTRAEEFRSLEHAENCLHFSGIGKDFKAAIGPADLQHAIADKVISERLRTNKSPIFIAQMKEPKRNLGSVT